MQPAAPPAANTLSIAPTMLIGLGGSGKDVLLRVRRLFYERLGKRNNKIGYPIVGYLGLDTDANALDRIEGETLSSFVLQNIQFERGSTTQAIDCSVPPTEFNQYFQGAKQLYRHIFSWLLPEMQRFGSSAIVAGAGQNRPFGRLAFFHHYPRIKAALKAQIKTIIDYARNPDMVAQWAPQDGSIQVNGNRLEVIVVYSLAGGTGAGMFLDAGMLAREVVAELSIPVQPYFTHFAVLPEPFVQDARENQQGIIDHEELRRKIQANAYASLREMEFFSMRQSEARFDLSIPPPLPSGPEKMAPPLYRVSWEPDKERGIHDCPWDTCYLIGGRNDAMGAACLPVREIYQMIAEHLFLDFDPNQFGTKKRSTRPNLLQQTLSAMKDPVKDARGDLLYERYLSKRFSTFGLSQLYFDRERMRRAASYRLAWLLAQRWWLRDSDMTPQEMLKAGREDLLEGAGGNKALVTNTGIPGDVPRAFGFDAIRDQVLSVADSEAKNWWEVVRQEATKLKQEFEDGNPMATGEQRIRDWLREHETRLQTTRASAGTEGSALREIVAQRHRLEPDAEKRLAALFRHRVHTCGVRGCQQLFKEYLSAVQKQIEEVDKVEGHPPKRPTDWEERVREAKQLFIYAKPAAREELLRSVAQVRTYLLERYRFAAAGHIRDTLTQLQGRFSPASPEGSYCVAANRFQRAMESEGGRGVLTYLNQRFDELRREDTSCKRTHGLLARWDGDDYDREIRRLIHSPSTRRDAPWDWEDIERRVLERLRASPATDRWRDIHSLGDLVLTMCNPKDTRPLGNTAIEEFARVLSEACESLLGKFADSTTALKEFEAKSDERANLLERLRVYSSPYLSRLRDAGREADFNTTTALYLGMTDHNTSDEAKAFRRDLTRVPGALDGGLDGMQPFDIEDDAIVLYQEKAGIPLCYYAGLTDLGATYDHYSHIPETHIDYPSLRERLPEIRRVNQEQQRQLAFCLENTLFAIIIGVIRREGSSFRMAVRSGGGLPLDYKLGTRLEEVASFFADRDNDTVRANLQRQVEQWLDNASSGGGEKMLALMCAIQMMREEIRRRIQFLIDQDKVGIQRGPRMEVHPLMAILTNRMLPLVRDRLRGISGVTEWLESPLNWEWLADRIGNLGENQRERIWRDWKRLLEGALELLDPVDLPIPVIRPQVQLRRGELTPDGIRELVPPRPGSQAG